MLVVAASVAIAACSDTDDDPGATAATTTTTVAEVPSRVDGRLTIGVMRPPAASLLRESLTLATEQAVDEINAAGGSYGGDVVLVPVDEGDTVASARLAIDQLLEEDVDAIIGPTSSVLALSTLEAIVSADVLACSPTASSLALDDFPDEGLFFRTIPSDSMQASAIVMMADQTGFRSVTIVYVDDAYGRPFADAVAAGLGTASIEVVDSVGFPSGDGELEAAVGRVIDADAEVVIVLANSNDGTQFLEALDDEPRSSKIDSVIVNDAMRSPESAQRIAGLDASTREKVLGVAPQAEADDPEEPFDPPGPFATNAFDCVTLIALAAELVQSDSGSAIASAMSSVSSGGSGCGTYETCVEALRLPREIDYNGAAGLTEIGLARGETVRARFDVFSFDDEGNDVFERSFPVGA